MNLVHEEHVARLEIGQHGGKLRRALEHWPGSGLDGHAHLVGDDVCQRGLAETGRPEDERVIERFVSPAGRLDEDLHLLPDRALTDVVVEPLRPQRPVEPALTAFLPGTDQPIGLDAHPLTSLRMAMCLSAARTISSVLAAPSDITSLTTRCAS